MSNSGEYSALWVRACGRLILILGLFMGHTPSVFAQLAGSSGALSTDVSRQSAPSQAPSCTMNGDAVRLNFNAAALNGATTALMRAINAASSCPSIEGANGRPGIGSTLKNILRQSGRVAENLAGGGRNPVPCINAAGSCQEPQITDSQRYSCDDFRGDNGTFSESSWDDAMARVQQSSCSNQCRADSADEALGRMDCMKRRMQALKRGMDDYRRTLDSELKCQKDYVDSVNREVARVEQENTSLNQFVSAEGPMGRARARLASLIGQNEPAIAACRQHVEEYKQKQLRFSESVNTVAVERGAQCFVDGNLESGIQGTCNLPGYRNNVALDLILCNYEMNLVARGQIRGGAHPTLGKLRMFKQNLNSSLGAGTYYRGGGEAGSFSGAENSPAARRGWTEQSFTAQMNNLLNQSRLTDPALAQRIRSLQQNCFSQAKRQVQALVRPPRAGQTVATDPEFQALRTNLERDGNAIMGNGTGPCGEGGLSRRVREYNVALEEAARAMFGSTGQWAPPTCANISFASNNGNVRTTNANLDRAMGCHETLHKLADSVLDGKPYPGTDGTLKAFPQAQLNVPARTPIMCAGMQNCFQEVQNRVAANTANVEKYKGDQDYTGANGQQMPGKQKFVRDRSLIVAQGVEAAGQAFNMMAAHLASQQDSVNTMMRGLGGSVEELNLEQYAENTRFDCPRPASPTGEQDLCEMPQNLTGVLGAQTDPRSFDLDRGPEALNRQMTAVRSRKDQLVSQGQRYQDLVRELNRKKSECEREDAVQVAQSINQGLDEILTNCQAADADKEQLCGSEVEELSSGMSEIEQYLTGRDGLRERRDYASTRNRINALCRGERSIGDYQNGTNGCKNGSEENRYSAAARTLCGSNEYLTAEDASSAQEGLEERNSRRRIIEFRGNERFRINDTDVRVACVIPCGPDSGCVPPPAQPPATAAQTQQVAATGTPPGAPVPNPNNPNGNVDTEVVNENGEPVSRTPASAVTPQVVIYNSGSGNPSDPTSNNQSAGVFGCAGGECVQVPENIQLRSGQAERSGGR